MVVNVAPPDAGAAYQHTPFMMSSSVSSGTHPVSPSAVHIRGWATPHATVSGGSPYAAFCSGPAETLRAGRSRTCAGSCEVTARQTWVARGDSRGAAICTGVDGTGAGALAEAAGAASPAPSGFTCWKTRKPASRATGTATTVAHRAATRAVRSGLSTGRVSRSTMSEIYHGAGERPRD